MAGASSPIKRLAAILDAVAASPSGLALKEIADAIGLPMATTHRMIHSLVDIGYVEGGSGRATFTIGPRLLRIFHLAFDTDTLATLVEPALRAQTEDLGIAAYLVQLKDSRIDLIHTTMPVHPSHTIMHPGDAFPINASAAGKVLFAHQPRERQLEELKKPLIAYDDLTLTDHGAILAELDKVKARGYGTSDEELDRGVLAVACPVELEKIGVIYSVGALGLKARMLADRDVPEIAARIARTAAEIKALLEPLRRSGEAS